MLFVNENLSRSIAKVLSTLWSIVNQFFSYYYTEPFYTMSYISNSRFAFRNVL